MSSNNKEKSTATIADLVAMQEAEKNGADFFQAQPDVAENTTVAGDNSSLVHIQDRLRSINMLVPGSKLENSVFDEYRRIKRPLLSNATGKTTAIVERGNLILVTSSLPGEGKSYTAMNLALSIAQERDNTVLLVDCDVTKQGASRMMGLDKKPGLVDVLVSENKTIGDVMLRTDIPGLCVLCAGKEHDYVNELLASQRMIGLVDEMAERYDDRIIIFDGPPLLPSPQTQILAGLVGQVVFVVEAGKTPQSLVEEALEMIPESQAKGVVMNKSEGISSRGGYYYGYYGVDQK